MRVMIFLWIFITGICRIFVQVTCKCTTGGARCGLSVNIIITSLIYIGSNACLYLNILVTGVIYIDSNMFFLIK